ncbi:hypothetical protein Fcan01_25885 [Folsomia candida]|uniref:Uncharacterized protein n=1 Tax=Folsomia candida TaxID=158441 RepID=A0A226D239_FOLCA|nr:hypothetical protein Fcan01_25885 [Folsomia candida]
MSKNRSYKTYFRSPTGEGGFKLPRRTTHRILEKCGQHKTVPSSLQEGQSPRSIEDVDDLQLNRNEAFQQPIDSSEEELSDDEIPRSTPTTTHSPLLFDGAKISAVESCLMVYGFASRHQLSKSALSDLLTLLNFHLPKGDSMPTSPYLAEKLLGVDIGAIKKIFYCEKCSAVLMSGACQTCGDKFNVQPFVKDGKYFLSFDVKQTIESTLQHTDIKQALYRSLIERGNRNETQIRDIMDGSSYKKLGLANFDITCCFNSDGISVFNSSRFSIWPILLSINELPYQLRRKHTLLIGLWFGDKKPNFDVFLQPFLDQSKDLATHGISWTFDGKSIKSNVYFPMVAADSPARCQLQGINQYNGEFSCPWCLIKGETYWIDERRHKWIFPTEKVHQSRAQENFTSHLRELRDLLHNGNNVTNVFGIKAPSKLILLPKFNIVDGFVFDYMHTCLLGVVRTLTCAWLDSKNHNFPFYVGHQEVEINCRINLCKFLVECQRILREVKDIKYWKAHEWKIWMIVAVPLLNGILSQPYLKHFSNFVTATTILCKDVISRADLETSDNLIKQFCAVLPDLYDSSYCSFNVHLVSHSVDCVKNWGPLWAYSLFQFENYNGVLTNSFSGTTEVGLQIAKKLIIAQRIKAEILSEII